MKKIKLGILSFVFAFLALTSCTNNEPVVIDQQTTEESPSIVTSLNQLKSNFDQNGNFSTESNPAGNIVFDFCFDFVYPITLSYNNGTTVAVNDLDELVNVILGSTEDLFVNGIAFPFNVEVYDEDDDAIEIETIEDEEDFIDLLEDCDFDDFDFCECTEEYDPVCVEITDPTGATFTITYPNECFAECDGFDEEDFIEDCTDDYYVGDDLFCFEFNFPLDIVIEGDNDVETVVTVNSFEELGNTVYAVYDFDFVYPFTVTLENGEIETIEDEDDIEDILEDCYDDYDDDDYDDECEECEDEAFDPVCIQYQDDSGNTVVSIFPNLCFAECLGFDADDVVDCEDDNIPADCTEDSIIENLTECEWYGYTSLLPQEDLDITFNGDGTLVVEFDDATIAGTWDTTSSPSGQVFMFFTLGEPLEAVASLDWTVVECSEGHILLQSNNEFLALEKDCD